MPIDYGNVAWPPADCEHPGRLYREDAAWYSGDLDELAAVYGGARRDPTTVQFFGNDTGRGWPGARALWRNFWHGRPSMGGQSATRIHIPAASDISALSADLLYGEPPAFTVADNSAATERLEDILDLGGAYATLLEGAETGSWAGGHYLRGCVDTSISDVPLADAVPPDSAIPEWRYGRLVAVTFWRHLSLPTGDDKVWRHLERHEVRGSGPGAVGVICHALYVGTETRLGQQWPLDAHPETARFAALVDADGAIPTGASRLDVAYVPNVRPNRAIRGTPLGRSDYAGAEPAMDALDETWSSWMRDIRLAKARIVVPQDYLRSNGRSNGATFDAEQEIFQAVNTMGDPNRAMEITQVQFAIRVAEHQATAAALWRVIMRSSGLSADAFGEEVDGGAATAKEIGRRGERTNSTRGRKISYATPALRHIGMVLLELDAEHYRSGVTPGAVTVEWPDGASIDPESQARTLQLLDSAAAVSTRVKVAMLHPDWADGKIDEEVALIDGAPLADPSTFTGAPPGVPVPTGVGANGYGG